MRNVVLVVEHPTERNEMSGMTVQYLLGEAADLSDEEIDQLAERMDDELTGGDPRPALRALRSLGQGNTGAPPADLDPLD